MSLALDQSKLDLTSIGSDGNERLSFLQACRTFFESDLEDNTINENSLSFSFFSSVIYFTKALLCLDVSGEHRWKETSFLSLISQNDRIKKILPGGETWLIELASIIQLVLARNDSTCMKVAVICLNLTMNAFVKWKSYVEFTFSSVLNTFERENPFSGKTQTPLTILPTFMNLSGRILTPEYVSIYVKYCYLDTLLTLVQTFLEWTPG